MPKAYFDGHKSLHLMMTAKSNILCFVQKIGRPSGVATERSFEVIVPLGSFTIDQESLIIDSGHVTNEVSFKSHPVIKVRSYILGFLPFRWFHIKLSESDIAEIREVLSNVT